MAEYIPPGRDHVITTREYSGTLEIIGVICLNYEQILKKINNKNIIIADGINYIENGMCRQIIELKFNKELTDKQKDKLEKLGIITYRIKQDYNTFDHNGYVKRECVKYKNISDSEKVRLWDIVSDKDGNEWEVAIMTIEPYYCEECNDTHDRWEEIENYKFKNREEAEKKYKSIKRKAA